MRKAEVYVDSKFAGILQELESGYQFSYVENYDGPAVSLTIKKSSDPLFFKIFPSFFEGLLPEGIRLELLLKENKIDRQDLFSQLLIVGSDLVGNVTVKEIL